jgi:hypothetical protein
MALYSVTTARNSAMPGLTADNFHNASGVGSAIPIRNAQKWRRETAGGNGGRDRSF